MLCLNCGKEIPVIGNVCPWCGAQKVQSQVTHGQWAAPFPRVTSGRFLYFLLCPLRVRR